LVQRAEDLNKAAAQALLALEIALDAVEVPADRLGKAEAFVIEQPCDLTQR